MFLRRIPSDVLVAGLALVISGTAAAAGWYQTHVIAQQLSAAVWPYVTVGSTFDGEHLRVNVRNDGLGPAIVESFVVSVDGKPQRSILSTLRTLVGRVKRDSSHSSIALSAVIPGEVIRSNGEVTGVAARRPSARRRRSDPVRGNEQNGRSGTRQADGPPPDLTHMLLLDRRELLDAQPGCRRLSKSTRPGRSLRGRKFESTSTAQSDGDPSAGRPHLTAWQPPLVGV